MQKKCDVLLILFNCLCSHFVNQEPVYMIPHCGDISPCRDVFSTTTYMSDRPGGMKIILEENFPH